MNYSVVNLVTFLVGIGFLLNGHRLVKSGQEDIPLFVMSSCIGIGLIVVAVFPDIFQVIATILGLELKARAILVISNLTLFVLATYLFNRIGKMHSNISRLNEEVSLLRDTVEQHDDD